MSHDIVGTVIGFYIIGMAVAFVASTYPGFDLEPSEFLSVTLFWPIALGAVIVMALIKTCLIARNLIYRTLDGN